MAVKIPQGFAAPIAYGNFRDAAGNPTTVESVVSIQVSDPTKAEIIDVGGVPHVAPLLTGNPVGDGQQVSVTVDVRFGPDVVPLTMIAAFDVPAGEAVAGDLALGEVVPYP